MNIRQVGKQLYFFSSGAAGAAGVAGAGVPGAAVSAGAAGAGAGAAAGAGAGAWACSFFSQAVIAVTANSAASRIEYFLLII